MSDQSPPPSPGMPGPHRRRSSFAEFFSPRSNATASASSSPPNAAVPSAASSSLPKRGVSISTIGLGGTSPSQGSPFNAFAKQRRASMSTSSGSGSPEFRNTFGDEPAVVEEGDHMSGQVNTPATPSFARRVSFGAQALRDVRSGSSGGGSLGGGRRPSSSLFTLSENNAPSSSSAASPIQSPKTNTATAGGEGFNWSEALRDKTKRSPSISSSTNPFASNTARPRAASVATMEPPKEMPKPHATPSRMKKPDQLGERMLRGDFMMD